MEKKKRPLRKYTAIAKIGYNKDTKENIFVKYRFNNIDNFLKFLTTKHTPLYCNIFYLAGNQRGKLCYTWGKNKGLQTAQ